MKYVYINCPSCEYRHGPWKPARLRDERGTVVLAGCPAENTEKKVHRYTTEHMQDIIVQVSTIEGGRV